MSQIRNRMRKRRLNSKEREILTPEIKPTTNGVRGGKLKVLCQALASISDEAFEAEYATAP